MLAITRLLFLWHSANRATRASCRLVISDCLPFPHAGRPFHRSHPAHSTLRVHHRQVRVDVSFLLRSQGSRLPRRVQFYAWAEFPQTLHVLWVRQPHTNSPARYAKSATKEIRISMHLLIQRTDSFFQFAQSSCVGAQIRTKQQPSIRKRNKNRFPETAVSSSKLELNKASKQKKKKGAF